MTRANPISERAYLTNGRAIGGSAIPDSVILQPKSDDLSNFSGDTSGWDINDNSPVLFPDLGEGLSIKHTNGDFIGSTSGLANYPDVGDTHVWFFNPDAANSNDSSTQQIGFGHNSASAQDDGYRISADNRSTDDDIKISRVDSGTATILKQTGVSWNKNSWHAIEILHESNGDITATVYDASSLTDPLNYDSGTQLASLTSNDSQYITSGAYDNTGIFFRSFQDATEVLDMWFIK